MNKNLSMFLQLKTSKVDDLAKFLNYLQWKTVKMHIPLTPKLQNRRTQSKAKNNCGVEFDI